VDYSSRELFLARTHQRICLCIFLYKQTVVSFLHTPVFEAIINSYKLICELISVAFHHNTMQ